MKRKLLLFLLTLWVATYSYGQTYLSEGFESGSLPSGWTNDYVSGTRDWAYQDGGNSGNPASAHTGSYNAIFSGDYSDDATRLVTSTIDLSSATSPQLSFWHAQADWGGDQDTLAVYYRTSSTDSWHYLGSWNNSITDWTQETFNLPSPSATYQIAFYGYEGYGYGVVLDDILVQEAPSCTAPSSQSESNITQTSVDLDWTENGSATTWDIEYGPTGFTQGSGTTVSGITAHPYSLSGLTANTTYDWYVRSDCGGGSYSSWTGPSTFTTLCNAVTTYPYSEDFATWPPDCWQTDHNVTGSTFDWTQYNSGGVECAKANFWGQSGGSTDIMITPQFDVSGLTTPSFHFKWSHKYSSSYPNDSLSVEVTDDGGSTWHQVWTKGGSNLESGDGAGNTAPGSFVTTSDIDLSSFGNTIQIRFYAYSGYGPDLFVDDVVVREMPTCLDPSAQTESNITQTSAELNWTENGSATSWDIELGTSGFTPTGTPTQSGVTNPYTYTGLTANTTYDWYVRADCGGGSYSSWVGASSFITEVSPNTVSSFPYNESFETDFGQWKQMNVDDFDWTRLSGQTGSSNTGPSSAYSGSYYIYTESSNPNNPDKTAGLLLAFDFSSLTTPQVTFGYHMYGSTMGTLQFEASTDNGATWDTIWSKTGDQGNQWNTATIMMNGYGGNSNVWLKIWGKTGSSYYSDMAIDSIDVREAPTCPDPTTQTENNVTLNSADLSWTENGSATSWQIMFDTTGFDTTNYTHTLVTSNPYSKTGLDAAATYDWYVRSVCGAGDTSNWVGAHTFTTSDGKAVNPVPANNSTVVAVTATTLDWDDVTGADGYHISVGTTSGGTDVVNNAAITGASNSSYTVSSNWNYSTTYYWTVTTDYNSGSTVVGDEWSFTTECDATDLPYFEAFDNVTAPDFPSCMKVENTNGDNKEWVTSTTNHSSPNAAKITYNSNEAMNDWFFTRGLNLTGGVTYQVNFVYRAGSSIWTEKLAVDWGNAASSTAMSGTPIFDNNNITNTTWALGSGVFTPSTTGTYYIGFHGYSDADQLSLYVDDIQVVQYQLTASWEGTADNDWTNENNWSGGVPPGSATDVTIAPGKSNYPTLTTTGYAKSVTIQSTSAGDGSLIGYNHLVTAEDATVQRYLTGGEWHEVAAMVSGATVNSFYFNHSPDVWMNQYKEATDDRTEITDLSTPMPLGTGFEAWVETGNNATATFTGTINSGDVTPTLSFTDAAHGYNLLGNPFSSAIQWGTGTWNLNNVDDQVWVWDHSAGSYKDYVAGSSSGDLTNGIIPMGQGFFVHANAASPSMTIPADAQVHDNTAFYKAGTVLPHFILSAKKGNREDRLWITFREGSTTAYENGFDGRKLIAVDETAAPQIYAVEESEEFSIDCLPPVDEKGKTIPVYFKANQNGEQTIEAVDLDLVPDLTVILEDTRLNVLQNLKKKPVYTFNAVTYQNPARFLLHLNRSVNGIGENEAADIKAFTYDYYLYVQSMGDEVNTKKQLAIYDMLGRKLVEKQVPPGDLIKIPLHLPDNYVIVKIVSKGKVYSNKVFIQ